MKATGKKILSVILSLVMVIGVVVFSAGRISADAATFDDINQTGVFFKQSVSGPCVLDSCAMMIRRVLIATEKTNWASVTESSLKGTACYEGWKVNHSFEYMGVSVRHATFDQSSATLKSLLAQHPEGIVLYSSSKGHAVLVTDYTNGSFYAADPSPGAANGRILFSQVTKVTVSNASAYWYVSSPKVTLTQSGAPTNVWLRAGATTVRVGEQVTFTYGAQGADSYTFSCAFNGKVTTAATGSITAQYTTAFSSPGTYTAHITAVNSYGSTDSQDVVITVYDPGSTYTVQFDANGGSGAPASQIKYNGQALTLSTSSPARADHLFLCWNTLANGSGTNYVPGARYTDEANVTLYAQWQKIDTTLQSISVKTNPTKTTYTVGETLNPAGLTLTARYANGSDKTVTYGFTCTTTVLDTAGQQTVAVAYGGKTTTFVVTVNSGESSQTGIRSVLLNDTTIYLNGKTTLKPVITVDGNVKYTLSYESSDPTIAAVTNEGEITGASEGIATVTVTVRDEAGSTASDSCTVIVRCSVVQWLFRVARLLWTWIRSLTAQA